MKTVIWVGAVLLVVIATSLGVNWYLEQTSQQLSAGLQQVQQLVSSGQWAEAADIFEQLDEQWAQTSGAWSAIIRHQEIDQLETTFGRIKQFIACREPGLALAELETARLLIEHIPEKERVKLSNIL